MAANAVVNKQVLLSFTAISNLIAFIADVSCTTELIMVAKHIGLWLVLWQLEITLAVRTPKKLARAHFIVSVISTIALAATAKFLPTVFVAKASDWLLRNRLKIRREGICWPVGRFFGCEGFAVTAMLVPRSLTFPFTSGYPPPYRKAGLKVVFVTNYKFI